MVPSPPRRRKCPRGSTRHEFGPGTAQSLAFAQPARARGWRQHQGSTCTRASRYMRANHGNGTFAAPVSRGWMARPVAVAVGDLNGDGELDIVVAPAGPLGDEGVVVFLNQGAGTFSNGAWYGWKTTSSFGSTRAVVLGDDDGVGDLDIASANPLTQGVAVALNAGDGTFTVLQYTSGGQTRSCALGDFDDDGRLDIAALLDTGVSVLRNTCVP